MAVELEVHSYKTATVKNEDGSIRMEFTDRALGRGGIIINQIIGPPGRDVHSYEPDCMTRHSSIHIPAELIEDVRAALNHVSPPKV